MPQFIEEFTFDPPGPAADTYNFAQNGVSFTVEFTDDGDGPDPSPGSGGIGFDANDGVGNSSSIDLLSDFPVSNTPERVTITRDDGEDFIFTSLFVNNEDADPPPLDSIDQQVTVAGFNDGVLVGTAQTVDDGEIATLNFGDIVVDEVRLTSNDFFLTKLDNFSGNTTVPVNTAPTITTSNAVSVPENQTSAIDVNATDDTDSEGSGLTYSLTGTIDDSLFNIDAGTGVVTFIAAPDFENPGDASSDNNYDIQVTVTDSGGLTDVQDIAITVTDVVENTAPTITTSNTVSVEENEFSAIDVNAIDDNDSEGSGLTYSLTGGADQGLFVLNTDTGELSFTNAPDFENPGDADGNNDYDIQVTVTDSGGLTDVQDIVVTVTDVVENTAPTITTSNTVSVEENQTDALDINADDDIDSEGSGLTYSLTGGDDQAQLALDANTGVLTFTNAPDFESPGDADGNNDYQVQVTVTDSGGLTDVQDLTVTVTDVAEQTLVISGETATSNLTIAAPTSSVSLSDYLLDAINSNGISDTPQVLSISVPTTATGINLTSFGKTNEATDGVDGSAWRLRNGTSEDASGTLTGYRTGFSNTYNLPANTDTFTLSPIFNGAATHRLTANSIKKVKAASPQPFNVTNDISGNAYEIIGGTGNDTLSGAALDDTLIGGAGADSFLYRSPDDGIDTIVDFEMDLDQILIAGAVFPGNLSSGVVSEAQFFEGTEATEAAHRFGYDVSSGNVFFDEDGLGGADAQVLATLTGTPEFDNNDLMVL